MKIFHFAVTRRYFSIHHNHSRDSAILHVSAEKGQKGRNPFCALARVPFIIYTSLCEIHKKRKLCLCVNACMWLVLGNDSSLEIYLCLLLCSSFVCDCYYHRSVLRARAINFNKKEWDVRRILVKDFRNNRNLNAFKRHSQFLRSHHKLVYDRRQHNQVLISTWIIYMLLMVFKKSINIVVVCELTA